MHPIVFFSSSQDEQDHYRHSQYAPQETTDEVCNNGLAILRTVLQLINQA
jgi:hypothetical protein